MRIEKAKNFKLSVFAGNVRLLLASSIRQRIVEKQFIHYITV